MAGKKRDNDKPTFDNLSALALGEGSKAHDYGSRKYERGNWLQGISYSRILNATIRHALARLQGEVRDPESGLLHSAHLMANANMLAHYEASGQYLDMDDTLGSVTPTLGRPKK